MRAYVKRVKGGYQWYVKINGNGPAQTVAVQPNLSATYDLSVKELQKIFTAIRSHDVPLYDGNHVAASDVNQYGD